MRVTAVVPFHADSESAEVTVTDGSHTCCAFCWPCSLREGCALDQPLPLFDSVIVLSEQADPWIDRHQSSALAHHGAARVLTLDGLLEVGGLRLQAEGLPAGIRVGDTVEFLCVRIDIGWDNLSA
jgi:hypothetical protein